MLQTNVLEPHPSLPVLATSGLDDQVKIWLPSNNSTLDWKEVEKVSSRGSPSRNPHTDTEAPCLA